MTREKAGVVSGVWGIGINALLAISKFVVGHLTNSVAITADAFNNLTDCLTSILTIIGFKISAKPADREHPFGHSRVEYIVSLAVAGVILLTGYEVMRSSIYKIMNPSTLYFTPWAIGVLLFAMGAKLWMYILNNRLGKKVNSETLLAIGIDSRNDILITAATFASLLFSLVSTLPIDGVVGALLALMFLRSGYKVAKNALDRIIGDPTDQTLANKISEIAKEHPEVTGISHLLVHGYGPERNMASIKITVRDGKSLDEACHIAKNIEKTVEETLGVPLVVAIVAT